MNKTVKQIEELKRQISYIEFQDHLSSMDYEYIRKLNAEINELEKQVKGLTGVAVHVTYKDKAHHISDGWYLTDDENLCCSDEPTLFWKFRRSEILCRESGLQKRRI